MSHKNAPERGLALDRADGRWVLTATVLGSAIVFLTSTVVNVALPAIGRGLGADTAEIQWVINGYLLALASLILIGGSLGDRFGRSKLLTLGSAAFAATSLLCGVSPSTGWLITFRVLQGVAAALLVPASLAIIQASFRPEDRGRAIGAWSALSGIAAAIGPVLGGWLIDTGSWRWLFFLNVPVALAVVVLALRKVPETRDPHAERLDVPGALAALVGLGALSWSLIHGPSVGWTEPLAWGSAGLGIVAVLVFLVIQRRSDHPMMPLDMFADDQFSAANGITFVVYAALGAVFFLLVVYLQTGLGYSALGAGLALLPITALMLVLSPRAGDVAQRRGARKPLTVGPLLLAGGMALMAVIRPGDGYFTTVFPAVVVFGLGLSATVAPVTTAVLAAADKGRSGVASGINNAVARTAQLVAVAVVPWIAGLSEDEIHQQAALAEGFPRAMYAMAALALVGAGLAWLTVNDEPLGS